MRIEKKLKNIRETKDSNSVEKSKKLVKIKNWFLTHRLSTRHQFNLTQFNFSTFLSFVPIALGFSQVLAYHLNSNQNISFFETTLPVFKKYKPKLNLEAVEYIVTSNKFLNINKFHNKLSKPSINPFFLANDVLVPKTQFSKTFGQPNFLAKIHKLTHSKTFNYTTPKQFTGLSCQFYFIPSGNFLSKAFSHESATHLQKNEVSLSGLDRTLDELPSYLQGLNQNLNFREPLIFVSTNPTLKENNITSATSQKNQNISGATHSQKNGSFYFSKGVNLFSNLTICNNQINLLKEIQLKEKKNFTKSPVSFFRKNERHLFRNDFSKNRSDFYNQIKQLNFELQNLFIEKNISYSPEFLQNSPELNTVLQDKRYNWNFLQESKISEKILQDLEKNQISEDALAFRSMSGYVYPDMKTTDLNWFYFFNPNLKYLQKVNFQNVSTKLPELSLKTLNFPSFSKNYKFAIKKLPKILIETRNIFLKNSDQNQVIYDGPSLVLNDQKVFDWKNIYEENLRSWFHNYLSPQNSLVQTKENFFGNYYSPQYTLDPNFEIFSEFKTNSFLRLKLTKTFETNWFQYDWLYEFDSAQSVFVPFKSSLHIPSQTGKQNQTVQEDNLRGIRVNFSKNKDQHENAYFLPLVELKQPLLNLSKNVSKNFSGYSPLFEFGVKGSPDSSFSPVPVNQQNAVATWTSGRYRKLSSVFSKKTLSNLFFIDNWEPLNSNSWLVVSQLSFAFFIFHTLKSLADNYGRELLGYLLDLVAALGFLDEAQKQQIELLTGKRNKGFRIFLESRKKFTDIVGIQKLLLEIYEIVLFLRNSGRNFTFNKTLPNGVLLIGPPGTGKTLLVQAIAGEAQVPVIALSGSSLIEPGESSAFKLQMAFQEARQLAPCIVFIDEIDTLSVKRSQIMQNPMANDEGFEFFLESLILESKISFERILGKRESQILKSTSSENSNFSDNHSSKTQSETSETENSIFVNSAQKEKQLSVLSQLLIEMNGIQGRDGVVVIGATNRPEVLDPALLRPGRFDKIIQVGLPEQNKRVEILKFYGQNLGFQKDIPWNYLGERTDGFTAADLATLMNESTIKAILNETTHTIETIEHGIDRLTTSESEKLTVVKPITRPTADFQYFEKPAEKENFSNKTVEKSANVLSISSKMSIVRFAYYQAGKILISYALKTHPKTVVACLWPRVPTIRSLQITTNLQNSLFDFARLREITDRLVGCYAGKAAEFLFLQKYSAKSFSQASTLGLEDLLFAQKLIYFLLENCRFFSKTTHSQRTIYLNPNVNLRELSKHPERLDLYRKLVQEIQKPPMWKAIQAETSSLRLKNKKKEDEIEDDEQTFYSVPWWLQEISDGLEFKIKNPANGSRIFLYRIERNERNPEWLPIDEYYHGSSGLKNAKKAFANILRSRRAKQAKAGKKLEAEKTLVKQKENSRKVSFNWNQVPILTRDYPAHSLVLQSFNKALVLLNENRELLDRLVVELLHQEILRKPEIENLVKEIEIKKPTPKAKKNKKQFQIVESPWGFHSRKPVPRWIDFAGLREETT